MVRRDRATKDGDVDGIRAPMNGAFRCPCRHELCVWPLHFTRRVDTASLVLHGIAGRVAGDTAAALLRGTRRGAGVLSRRAGGE